MKDNKRYASRCNQLESFGMNNVPNAGLEIGKPDGYYMYSLPNVNYYAAISHEDINRMSKEDWNEKVSELKQQIVDMDNEPDRCPECYTEMSGEDVCPKCGYK